METIRYITSLVLFYLKGEIRFEKNFVHFSRPNTILGIIPLGKHEETIPVDQISAVGSNFRLLFLEFLLSLGIFIVGLICVLRGKSVGLWGMGIGLYGMVTSFRISIYVQFTSGRYRFIPFYVFEKDLAEKAVQQIQKLIGARMNETNVRNNVAQIQKYTNYVRDHVKGIREQTGQIVELLQEKNEDINLTDCDEEIFDNPDVI